MRERANLWRLYNAATAYGKRPSEFFVLETELAEWQLDEACLLIGRRVENNLAEGKEAFAGFEETGIVAAMKRGYRSAKRFVKRKMRIPESGVW